MERHQAALPFGLGRFTSGFRLVLIEPSLCIKHRTSANGNIVEDKITYINTNRDGTDSVPLQLSLPSDAAGKGQPAKQPTWSERKPSSSTTKTYANFMMSATWISTFLNANRRTRTLMIRNTQTGSGRGLRVVPTRHWQMDPASYTAAKQFRLGAPLTCLKGTSLDPITGGDLLRCRSDLIALRTSEHDCLQREINTMLRSAGGVVRDTSKKRRSQVQHYSPNHVPDTKLANGSASGHHILIDFVTVCPTSAGHMEAASCHPLSAASDSENAKRADYGDVTPNEVLPFAVEDCGGLGHEALSLIRSTSKKMGGLLNERDEARSNWSCRDFSSYWISRVAYVTTREMGDFFIQATNDIKDRADPEGIWTATTTPELLTVADPAF